VPFAAATFFGRSAATRGSAVPGAANATSALRGRRRECSVTRGMTTGSSCALKCPRCGSPATWPPSSSPARSPVSAAESRALSASGCSTELAHTQPAGSRPCTRPCSAVKTVCWTQSMTGDLPARRRSPDRIRRTRATPTGR